MHAFASNRYYRILGHEGSCKRGEGPIPMDGEKRRVLPLFLSLPSPAAVYHFGALCHAYEEEKKYHARPMKEGGLLDLGVTCWLLPKAEKAVKSRFEEVVDENRKARNKARTC